ncbi:fimbrial protein [Ralstonia chuxiongensis]|uniref:Type 1 fimbrial protein n=1 Tax=Ralstonia chuxiongensis TaxID=2957504 RepID=A0AA42BHE6_9RALS|nr:fimbrial protein [Ralstonia chuxiongensis]MCP1172769.1 type 1 fimbrial protein [Ralstonia chuxiongensis]
MNEIFLARKSSHFFGGLRMRMVIGLAMFSAAPSYAANCEFQKDQKTKNLTFTIPSDLRVPRDAPVGTVVWESAVQSGAGANNADVCADTHKWGLVNGVGASASAARKTELPIGTTGLAWSFVYENSKGKLIVEDLSLGGFSQGGGRYGWENTKLQLQIKKIGPVTAGASVPAGRLGYLNKNNEIDLFSINTSNKASVGTRSCKTPDVVVRMGDRNRVGQFKGVGTSLAPVNFSINLKECPSAISKVSYLLKPNTQIVDATQTVVALDAGSVAKGVGLQVLNQNGKPVTLNETVVYSEYDKVGGNFSIPFKAAYYQTAPVVEAGSANSSLTLVMSYE